MYRDVQRGLKQITGAQKMHCKEYLCALWSWFGRQRRGSRWATRWASTPTGKHLDSQIRRDLNTWIKYSGNHPSSRIIGIVRLLYSSSRPCHQCQFCVRGQVHFCQVTSIFNFIFSVYQMMNWRRAVAEMQQESFATADLLNTVAFLLNRLDTMMMIMTIIIMMIMVLILIIMILIPQLILVTTATTGGSVLFSSRRTFFLRERKRDCF